MFDVSCGHMKFIDFLFQDFISRVNDVDNMLEDLESQYDSLKADGYVTASDGLKAQVSNKPKICRM